VDASVSKVMTQTAPWPHELEAAVAELRYVPGWRFTLTEETRGQDCAGLTLSIFPDKQDSYHPKSHVNTVFTYPVPAASFNRESWEEWLWGRIEDTENHERAEWFRFVTITLHTPVSRTLWHCDAWEIAEHERRPFKPAHADGWDPSVVRTVVSETVVNTPNAGRLVRVPCAQCPHHHGGRMGEHFT
jgi:hypothetical protein